MLILGREKLHAFASEHADARGWIENWIAEVRRVRWESPHDVRAQFASASFLAGSRIVFNVKGNRYRLEVQVAYLAGAVRVCRIGTHEEYMKWT